MIRIIHKNKQSLLILFTLFLAVFIGYMNVLNAPFHVDDKASIVNNPNVGNFKYLISEPKAIFAYLPNYIAYKIGGLTPFYYRIFNLLFHFGTAVSLYFIVKRLFNTRAAILTSLLFSIHPILVESVTWISALSYTKSSFFLMFSILSYLKGKENRKWYILSIFSAWFAILSSEKAVVLPILLLLVEFTFFSIRKNWKQLIPYFVIVAFVAGFYILNIDNRIEAIRENNHTEFQSYNPVEHVPYAVTYYLQLILFPKDLTLYHSELTISMTEFLIRWAVFIVLIVSLVMFHKKSEAYFFWMTFFLIAISPTLLPSNIVWVVAERYVYLGTVGVVAVFGYGISKLLEFKKYQSIIYAVFTLVVIMLLGRTIVRNADWLSDESLWISAIKASPSSASAHNNMGDVYSRRKDYVSAALEFKRATELRPNHPDAFHNLGIAYTLSKQIDLAIPAYEKATEINPRFWQAHQNLGVIYYGLKKFDLAKPHLEKALQFGPNNNYLKELLDKINQLQ